MREGRYICRYIDIYRLNRNKSPLKISGKVAVDIVRDKKKFRAPVYRAHRAVSFAIAQLSCFIRIFTADHCVILAQLIDGSSIFVVCYLFPPLYALLGGPL